MMSMALSRATETWCLVLAFLLGCASGMTDASEFPCCNTKAVAIGDLPETCDASNAGSLYYSRTTRRLVLCDGFLMTQVGAATGAPQPAGRGTHDNPITSCSALRGNEAKSGTYWMKPLKLTGKGPFQIYCDFDLRPNGCALVWKHSYLQVPPNDDMRTFSTFNKPCTDLSHGWCNVFPKDVIEGSEQVTAAYHYGKVVYAYKGDRNPQLGKAGQWQGAILNRPVKIKDYCIRNNGVAPEPEHGSHAKPGLTFDKENPGRYIGNCDTDRYAYSSGRDCRWENCHVPGNIGGKPSHSQMTVAIYIC